MIIKKYIINEIINIYFYVFIILYLLCIFICTLLCIFYSFDNHYYIKLIMQLKKSHLIIYISNVSELFI